MKTTIKKSIRKSRFLNAILSFVLFHSVTVAQNSWNTNGNLGSFSNFIGTTNNYPFLFRTNNVEDAQNPIGDYLARLEIAPEKLYLSNRKIGEIQSGYIAEFDARQKIFVGKNDLIGENIYAYEGNENFLTPNEKFIVKNNSTLILHAGEEIALLPGTEIEFGSNLATFIEPFNCANLLQRFNPLDNLDSENIESEKFESINAIENIINRVYVFPNPNNGSFTIDGLIEQENYTIIISDFAGKILNSIQIRNSKNQLSIKEDLTNGVYFISVNGSKKRSNHKLIIQN